MTTTPIVILIRPQLGENIGAVARAMSNFGLETLRIVDPRDGWPNPKAEKMAAGGEAILTNAQIFPDVNTAFADIHLAYASTARRRDMEKPMLPPEQAMAEIHQTLAASPDKNIALVLGPERSGLSNEDLTLCDTLITIPTSAQNASLNLGQCMVIMGYVWFRQQSETLASRPLPELAPKRDWQEFFGQLEHYLDTARYFRADKKPLMWHNLQTMLSRAQLSAQEIRTLRGMLRDLWEYKG